MHGRALRRWRQLAGIKQAHLAELLDVTQSTVSRWEAGAMRPAPGQARALARLQRTVLDPARDAYLKRLVESSRLPVHLICDTSHRLLAASPAREAEWQRRVGALLGMPLLAHAPDDIRTEEARLDTLGWFDGALDRLELETAGRDGRPFRILPGRMLWERIATSSGFVRLVTTHI